MKKKQFAVIGLGRFGRAVATQLAEAGYEVIAVDIHEDIVQNMSEVVTYAVTADVTKKGVCESLGLRNVDGVVIAIASDMEDSILSTIMAKEAGAPFVVAKAVSEIHATILKKVGADQVVFPERDSGSMLAKSLASGIFAKFFTLSDSYSIVELTPPADWVGKNLIEIHPRKKYGVNIIGIIDGAETRINIDPQEPVSANWTLIVLGTNDDLKKITD